MRQQLGAFPARPEPRPDRTVEALPLSFSGILRQIMVRPNVELDCCEHRPMVAPAVAAHRAAALRGRSGRARPRAAADAPGQAGSGAEAIPWFGARARRRLHLPQLPDSDRLRSARLPLHPAADREVADRDGLVRRLRDCEQRRLRAALRHVGALPLLLALGAERPGDLARRAVLLRHVLARPAGARRMGARRRADGAPRRLRRPWPRPRDGVAAAGDGVRVSDHRGLPPTTRVDRRARYHAAVDRPGDRAVRAVGARLEPGGGRPLRPPARAAA